MFFRRRAGMERYDIEVSTSFAQSDPVGQNGVDSACLNYDGTVAFSNEAKDKIRILKRNGNTWTNSGDIVCVNRGYYCSCSDDGTVLFADSYNTSTIIQSVNLSNLTVSTVYTDTTSTNMANRVSRSIHPSGLFVCNPNKLYSKLSGSWMGTVISYLTDTYALWSKDGRRFINGAKVYDFNAQTGTLTYLCTLNTGGEIRCFSLTGRSASFPGGKIIFYDETGELFSRQTPYEICIVHPVLDIYVGIRSDNTMDLVRLYNDAVLRSSFHGQSVVHIGGMWSGDGMYFIASSRSTTNFIYKLI